MVGTDFVDGVASHDKAHCSTGWVLQQLNIPNPSLLPCDPFVGLAPAVQLGPACMQHRLSLFSCLDLLHSLWQFHNGKVLRHRFLLHNCIVTFIALVFTVTSGLDLSRTACLASKHRLAGLVPCGCSLAPLRLGSCGKR